MRRRFGGRFEPRRLAWQARYAVVRGTAVRFAAAGAVLAVLLAWSDTNARAAEADRIHDTPTDPRQTGFRTVKLVDSHGYGRFTLSYNREKILVEARGFRLSLVRSGCNAHNLDRFVSAMGKLIAELARRDRRIRHEGLCHGRPDNSCRRQETHDLEEAPRRAPLLSYSQRGASDEMGGKIQLFSKSGFHDGTLKAIPFRTIQPVGGAEIVRRSSTKVNPWRLRPRPSGSRTHHSLWWILPCCRTRSRRHSGRWGSAQRRAKNGPRTKRIGRRANPCDGVIPPDRISENTVY